MTALVVSAWSVTVIGLAWRFRPASLDARPGLALVERPQARTSHLNRSVAAMASLGGAVQRRVPPLLAVPTTSLGAALVVGASLSFISPMWGLVASVVTASVAWHGQRAARQRRRRRLEQELPTFVDLIRLSIDAGLTVRVALVSLADHVSGEIGSGLAGLVHDLGRGEPLSAGLRRFGGCLGPPVDELMTMLVSAEGTGAPVGPALARFADDLRRRGRVVAEERARRLPVLLLMPLVFCVLPAFVIVAVVPMLATGAAAYSFPSR